LVPIVLLGDREFQRIGDEGSATINVVRRSRVGHHVSGSRQLQSFGFRRRQPATTQRTSSNGLIGSCDGNEHFARADVLATKVAELFHPRIAVGDVVPAGISRSARAATSGADDRPTAT